MLDHNELAAARRIAHTLKCSAGMIGAQQVYQLATGLEAACATSVRQGGIQLDLLDPALGTLLTTIAAMLEQADDAREPDTAAGTASQSRPHRQRCRPRGH